MGESSNNDVPVQMAGILATMLTIIGGLIVLQTPKNKVQEGDGGGFLPSPATQPSKRSYEIFVMCYTPIWISAFGCIVAFGLYETFDEWSYMKVCVGLALPFLLQPILLPSAGCASPDARRPLLERYSTKANLWIAVYSFIGNYWYTHYFYSVLKAKYTMPAHRLNNVPIALYFATHFYFSTYHAFSNLMLRYVSTSYQKNISRSILFVSVVLCFSYFTAFMETLTISAYPDYSFEDRDMAYTVGSAFYAIYFIVSFPAFFQFDDEIDAVGSNIVAASSRNKVTLYDTFVSSCGHGMIIMILLDFVRLYLDIPLIIGTPL